MFQHTPDTPAASPEAAATALSCMETLPSGSLSKQKHALYMTMCAYGDGGWWCDRVITPLFVVLAFEVAAHGHN